MVYNIIKIVISAILIVLISEIAKRNTLFGSVLASIPLVSVLAMIWLYIDTQNTQQVVVLSKGIFWMVLPSLVLFITLPIFLKLKLHFYISLTSAIGLTVLAYFLMLVILEKFNIRL
mgnify:CR=1 FL=1